MPRARLLLVLGVALILLLLGLAAGIWWYLFGGNKVAAAELVPGDTVLFATIPNGAAIVAGYQSSQLKTLVDSPNAQPVFDTVVPWIGQKNVDLLKTFAPNLSGQSFIAITHLDVDHPEHTGFIAGMKPKAGLGNFDAFVEQLKATWPDALHQGTTGTGSVAGVDYEWIRGPNAPDKFCVAKVNGWIITTWGEAGLQDWIERYHHHGSSPSLAQNPEYLKSLTRIGPDPLSILFVDYRALLTNLPAQATKANPGLADYLSAKLGPVGDFALGTKFEGGKIVDRFSLLTERATPLDLSFAATPCPFDTLKFTGPTTSIYWASSVNFSQLWKGLEQPAGQSAPSGLATLVQGWAQSVGLDVQHTIIDALGSEISVQAEWNADTPWPEAGLFVKVDKPDVIKPAIAAFIETVRQAYSTTAVIQELQSGTQNFAVLKFVQDSPFSPTITEDGPYLGIFLSPNQAVRSFLRDQTVGLLHNDHFKQEVGNRTDGASGLVFVDTPQLLDRTYRTVLPYVSLASAFNKTLAGMLKDKTLPDDLTWLAPMDTWSCVLTPGDAGLTGYSVSGIGNQGMFLLPALATGVSTAQSAGYLPKTLPAVPAPAAPAPAPSATSPPPPSAPVPDTGTNAPPTALPDASTNSSLAPLPAPASPAGSSSNAVPAAPDVPKPQ